MNELTNKKTVETVIGEKPIAFSVYDKLIKLNGNTLDNNVRFLKGYKAYTGKVFTEKEAKIYNRHCDQLDLIEKLRINGKQSDLYQAALNSRAIAFKYLSQIEHITHSDPEQDQDLER